MNEKNKDVYWKDKNGESWCLVKNIDGRILEMKSFDIIKNAEKFKFCEADEPYAYEAYEDIVIEEKNTNSNILGLMLLGSVTTIGIITNTFMIILCIYLLWSCLH